VGKVEFTYLSMHAMKFALLFLVLSCTQLWCCVTVVKSLRLS